MNKGEDSAVSEEVAANFVGVLATVFVLCGIIVLLIGGLSKTPLAQSILINIGSGFLTSGILSFVFDRLTRKIGLMTTKELRQEHIQDIANIIAEDGAIMAPIRREISVQTRQSHIFLAETMKAMFSEDIQRHVFSAGLIGARTMYSGRLPKDFLLSQQQLKIFLKDGFTFFRERKAELKERFRGPTFKTELLVLHPEYSYMTAVAHMDLEKRHDVNRQVDDCRAAIEVIQQIREELLAEGVDIRNRVQFIGYRLVPTWTGFIGDSLAYVGFYFTRPYRGPLNFLVLRKSGNDGEETLFYESYRSEYDQLLRESTSGGGTSLFDYLL